MMYKILFLFFFLLAFFACTDSEELSFEQFPKYILNKQNGLVQTQQRGLLSYNAYFMPSSYWEQKEMGTALKNKSEGNTSTSVYREQIFIRLDLLPKKYAINRNLESIYKTNKPKEEWTKVKTDLMLHAAAPFTLVVNGESLACKIASTDFLLGDKRCSITLVFDRSAISNDNYSEDLILVFSDNYFAKEKIQFVFKKEDLNNIPALKMTTS